MIAISYGDRLFFFRGLPLAADKIADKNALQSSAPWT
jgi:hypothetical protein